MGNPNTKTFIIFVFVILFFSVIFIPNAELSAEKNFNKTFAAVKSNTDIVFSKTDMNESEKHSYIENTCQIVFGNGVYRDKDVELCKSKMDVGK